MVESDIFGGYERAWRKRKADKRQVTDAEVRGKFSNDEWLTMLKKMRQALTIARVNPAKANAIFDELRKSGEARKLHGQDVLRVLDWRLKNDR